MAGVDTVPCVIDVNEVITEEAIAEDGQLRVDDQIMEVNLKENDITPHRLHVGCYIFKLHLRTFH